MSSKLVGSILEKVNDLWPLANDIEVTLEANPTSVEANRFQGFHRAGINRISMGIQSLNDQDLKRLGRLHSVDEALAAFEVARNQFDRVSFDLIYARQDQSLSDWQSELERALGFELDHLSLYQLTIEQGTAFGSLHRAGKFKGLPKDELAADMYDLTQSLCEDAGLPAYEISNHARLGFESKHNLIYWRSGDYIGVGPGAHGRFHIDGAKHATETHLMPNDWLKAVSDRHSGQSASSVIDQVDQADEYLMMSLRLREGSSLARYESLAGKPLNQDSITELTELGFVSTKDDTIFATQKGRIVLNAVLERLLVD